MTLTVTPWSGNRRAVRSREDYGIANWFGNEGGFCGVSRRVVAGTTKLSGDITVGSRPPGNESQRRNEPLRGQHIDRMMLDFVEID